MPARSAVLLVGGVAAGLAPAHLQAQHPAIVSSGFIYDENARTPEAHASTIVETPSGLVAAWFGGEHEGHPEVRIWVARYEDGDWTDPVAVADGVQLDGTRLPTWNPVLFQPTGGQLYLFYKVGPSPSTWWGMVLTSDDDGGSWSSPDRLPEGVYGPIRSKPVQLANGVIIAGSSTEDDGWRVHFETSRDGGRSWEASEPLNDGQTIQAIQPTILRHADGRLQAIGRTRNDRVFTTESSDGGASWGPLALTELPNPSAGTDVVTLLDGRHLHIYNHTVRTEDSNGRWLLNVAVSRDGLNWEAVLVLENDRDPAGYSYPAAIQTSDGLVHITYTWRRSRVRHVVLDPSRLTPIGPIVDGEWPGNEGA